MSELDQLIQGMATASGTPEREIARAKIDALLAKDLASSLGQLVAELASTRKQMAASSLAASRHERALVSFTAVLAFATIAYAVASFWPLFSRPFARSVAADRAWVLWMESPVHSKQWRFRYAYDPPTFETKKECDEAARRAEAIQTSALADATKRGLPLDPRSWFVCLPDTLDPRAPKGK